MARKASKAAGPRGRRGFPVVLTLFTLVALSILCGLGYWQLQRLAWKQDLLAHIAALEGAPARPVDTVLNAGGDIAYARVVAACPGLATAPYVELYALSEGRMGSRLISACRLEAGGRYGSILVDRGFVGEEISARPPVQEADPRPNGVRGILRAPDPASVFTPQNVPGAPRFFGRQVGPLAAALKAERPAPWFLMAETSTNPQWLALKAQPLPAEISNRHLEYALTWFGLAAALLAVYAALLRSRFKR